MWNTMVQMTRYMYMTVLCQQCPVVAKVSSYTCLCSKVLMAACSLVRQEVEFIHMETKVLTPPPLHPPHPLEGGGGL